MKIHNKIDYKDKFTFKDGSTGTSRSYQVKSMIALAATILLGVIFTCFQVYEYYMAPFTIADGTFGCTFFMLTGIHGIHVLVGTIFLIVICYRLFRLHFGYRHFAIAAKQCI